MEEYSQMIRQRLEAKKDSLTELDIRIITLRFGLDDGIIRNLEDTAWILGITRERIRIAENRVLRPRVQAKRRVSIRDFYKNS